MNKHFYEWPKTWIQKYVSEMLQKIPVGTKLTGMDEEIILWLINRHPKASDKIGVGIKYIRIAQDKIWKKNKHMEIVRQDGSVIDFSYKKCLSGKDPSGIELFRIACRNAVSSDIAWFKKNYLKQNPVCRHRGIALDQDNSHVDHVKPKTFIWLVDKFIKKEGIVIDKVEIEGEIKKRFKNREIEERFKLFHRETAELELVSAEANQKECK